MDKRKIICLKENERSYMHWTETKDTSLSTALLEQQGMGNKGAKGWKGPAFKADIQALKDECDVIINKEKIIARLKTWNKYYIEISALLDTSRFGWDWERNVVRVDSEEVWASYVQVNYNFIT